MSTANNGRKRQHGEDDPGEGTSKRLKTPFSNDEGEYEKGGISRNFHGDIYQLKILMLFMKRALKQGYNFRLGTEVKDADKLDDVLFQYTDQNGKTCYRFLQAKHKQNEIKKDKIGRKAITAVNLRGEKEYGLPQYFFSYLKIKETISSDEELKDFVICTNIDLNLDSLEKENIVAEAITTRDDILEVIVPGKTSVRYKLKIDIHSKLYEMLKEVYTNFKKEKADQLQCNYSRNPDEEIQKFLDKLVLAVNQPNEEQLGQVIDEELGEKFNLLDSHLVTDSFMITMLNWLKKGSPGQFLTPEDGNKIFERISNEISSLKSIGLTIKYLEKLKYRYSQFLFLDEHVQHLIQFLENGKNTFFHLIAEKRTALIATKVLQALERVQKTSSLYKKDDSYIFLLLKSLNNKVIEKLITDALQTCKLLIIDCKSIIQNINSLQRLLNNVASRKRKLKVIVISLDKLKLDYTSHSEYMMKHEPFFWDHLTEKSQEELLKNEIKFQGQNISVENLISSENLDSIDSELLLSLVDDSQVAIGENLRDLGELSNFYVSRMLIRNGNSFRENNFFEAVINEKLVCLSDAAGTGKSVFLTRLAQIIKRNYSRSWVVRIDLNDHVNELGNLTSHETKEFELHDAIDILAAKLMDQDDLSSKLFKQCCMVQQRVVLLLDGVDEISPKYKNVVLELVKALKLSKIQQIVMTTRPHMKEEIENELCLTAFTLKSFTIDDQVKLLTKFWGNLRNKHNVRPKAITTFAQNILESLSDIIEDEKHEFTGIPLLIRIVAESYAEKVKKYTEKTLLSTRINVKLTNLYRDFVKRKFEIFQEEKGTINCKNLADSLTAKGSYEILFKTHEAQAFFHLFEEAKSMFKPEVINDYNSEEKTRTGIVIGFANKSPKFIHRTFAEYFAASFLEKKLKNQTDTKKILSILLLKIAKNPEFVVLRSFIDELLEKSKVDGNILRSWSEKQRIQFFKKCRTVDGFCQSITEGKASLGGYIYQIFNRDEEICKQLIHFKYESGNNLLHQTIEEARNTHNQGDNSNKKVMPQGGREKSLRLLVERKCDILAKNEKGETPLHLAIQVDHFRIIQYLVNENADVNALNNNGDTALHYSVQLKKDHKLVEELLFSKQIEINMQNSDGKTALHIAVVRRKSNKAVFLIDSNTNIRLKDNLGNTVLHYAAAWGNPKIVDKLMGKNADVLAENIEEKTPLHMTVESYSCKLNTVKLLFEAEASISTNEIFVRSVLDCATRFKNSITESKETSKEIKKTTKEISKIITFLNNKEDEARKLHASLDVNILK